MLEMKPNVQTGDKHEAAFPLASLMCQTERNQMGRVFSSKQMEEKKKKQSDNVEEMNERNGGEGLKLFTRVEI